MSVIVTKKTHFQDSQDLDEFNIIAADWLSLQLLHSAKKKIISKKKDYLFFFWREKKKIYLCNCSTKKCGPYSFGQMWNNLKIDQWCDQTAKVCNKSPQLQKVFPTGCYLLLYCSHSSLMVMDQYSYRLELSYGQNSQIPHFLEIFSKKTLFRK